jgi:hypothetical protein
MTTDENTGAAKYRAKQRREWAIDGGGIFIIGVIGYGVGGYVGYAEGMQEPVQNFISAQAAWALALLFLTVFWGGIVFAYKHADEVEIHQSNLAFSVALLFYIGVFLTSEALYFLGVAPFLGEAPAMHAWFLFGATNAVGIITYLLLRYWPR